MTAPPVLPPPASSRSALVWLLGATLALFFLDAAISLLDDTIILFTQRHLLALPRALVFLPAAIATFLVYILMAFLPAIPKRVFLPVTLFNPVALVAVIPLLIYFHQHIPLVAWCVSFAQFIAALWLLKAARGAARSRWPLFPAHQLLPRRFRWSHLIGFIAANVFILLPGLLVYFGFCGALAIDHASAGFVNLRPRGIILQSREYTRADGKAIRLVPMTHIGDASFYRLLADSFPTNATILMEGVTDKHNLLTNTISYKRAAKKLGLAEQHQEFRPPEFSLVRADVDVSEFGTNTLAFLNLIMRLHSRGAEPETLRQLLQFQPPPNFERDLFGDILHKRNRHLLGVIKEHLPESDVLVVPWGAAHMPEVARELEQDGFRIASTEDRLAVRFGGGGMPASTNTAPAR